MIEITVRDGIGARVTTIANALSSGQECVFGWAVNEHCPLPHQAVFPDGIAGVRFVEPEGDGIFTYWNGRPFFCWEGADCRPLANVGYARIMDAMAGEATGQYKVGVHGRFFRNPHGSPAALARTAWSITRNLPSTEIFLLTDTLRNELSQALAMGGNPVVTARCLPLSNDLARTPEDTLLFLSDWKTLLACQVIVAIDGATCMLNPARASGRTILYA